jgi:hypothetical protein
MVGSVPSNRISVWLARRVSLVAAPLTATVTIGWLAGVPVPTSAFLAKEQAAEMARSTFVSATLSSAHKTQVS